MDMEEKKISGEEIFKGKVVHVIKDKVLCPNGHESYREIVRHPGGAAILCITSDNKVMLERQFRYAYNEVIYEIPAGKLETGEDPKEAAYREFEEETGNKADNLVDLIKIYPTCGYSSEVIHIYLVDGYKPTKTHFDPDEVIEMHYIDYDEVKKMIADGQIKDAKTICAIMQYENKYKKN